MESKLSLQEFRVRLINNTQVGSTKSQLGKVRIFPMSGAIKPFYGFFDDKSFRLKVNSPKSSTPFIVKGNYKNCLLYTSPSPRDRQKSRMPSSA